MKNKLISYPYILYILFFCVGCKKEWLEIKPDKSLSVPETLTDLQAILDDQNVLNRQYAIISNAGTDNVYVADADAGSLSGYDLDQYIWNSQIKWFNDATVEWSHPFTVINSANIVLDGIKKLSITNPEVKNLKGQALFYRAYAYYTLAQVFCKPYKISNSQTDLGLPIRLNSDVNEVNQRSSLQEVYDLMLTDLTEAVDLLPVEGAFITRTNSIAAQALLSRVYLTMGDYNNAKTNADGVLAKKATLIDYNNNQLVSPSRTFRFPANGIGNPEILFYAFSVGGPFRNSSRGHFVQASQQLYDLYDENDLRKHLVYSVSGNKVNFVGNYTGTSTTFSGLATNEIYLIRAECNARSGKVIEAQKDLNQLLLNRYKTGTAPTVTETNQKKLLHRIIIERRKELPRYANSRWEDLRRFNLEPDFAISQSHTFLGQIYTLLPNSPKYVLNIPNNEIRISGLEQNQR